MIARDEPTVGAAFAVIEAYLPLHNDALVVTRERLSEIMPPREWRKTHHQGADYRRR